MHADCLFEPNVIDMLTVLVHRPKLAANNFHIDSSLVGRYTHVRHFGSFFPALRRLNLMSMRAEFELRCQLFGRSRMEYLLETT